MPTYTFRDKASGSELDAVMPYADYAEYLASNAHLERVLVAPSIITENFTPFESPATGKMITSRAEHRYDLAASGCRIMEPDESPTKGRLRNPTFTAKRGLSISDEYRDYDSSKPKEAT